MDNVLRCTKNKNIRQRLVIIFLCIYFLSLPLGAMALGKFGSILKCIAILPILGFILEKNKFKLNKIMILQLVYTILIFSSLLYTVDIVKTMQRLKTNIMFLILLLYIGSIYINDKEIHMVKKSLVWSSRITCIILLLFGTTSSDRLLLNGFITEDPNYLNGYLFFGIAYAVEKIIDRNNFKSKVLYSIEITIYIYIILATGSRSGLFSAIAVMFIMFCFGDKKRGKLGRKALVIFILMIATPIIIKYIPDTVLNRFTVEAIIESKGTNRIMFWEWAYDIFKSSAISNKIFGYGAGSIREIYLINGYIPVVCHNIYIEQLLEGGLLTLAVYLIIISSCIIRAVKLRSVFSISIMIGFIILSMQASLYAFKPYWNIILFISLLNIKKNVTNYRVTIYE